MNVIETCIPEIKIICPALHEDERGHFCESYNQREFESAIGHGVNFVQDNHSLSHQGVLRGLHYQASPMEQGKLIRVTHGEIFDVAVDIRKNSPTFGKSVSLILSSANRYQLWIPPGFAHGFYTITDYAECIYKVTNYYSVSHEYTLLWNDPDLNIPWPFKGQPILSIKDRENAQHILKIH